MSAHLLIDIQLFGAFLILLAYWANAAGTWTQKSSAYLWVNLIGALLLGIVAVVARQPGFILLEAFWAGISLVGLLRRRPARAPGETTSQISDDRERLLALLQTRAYKRGHFILASGKESTYYLDGRLVTLSPEGADLTGKLIFEQIKDLDVQAVGGLTMGADPIAAAVAVVSFRAGQPIPAFLVRKEAKGHGTGKQVEGPLPANARAAIVEDTITTGASVLYAIEAVEALGCTVAIVLALVDREEGAREMLQSKGYIYKPLFTVRDME